MENCVYIKDCLFNTIWALFFDCHSSPHISILSGSEIIFGVTIAGFTSALRQIIWLRKVPLIEKSDLPPDLGFTKNEN